MSSTIDISVASADVPDQSDIGADESVMLPFDEAVDRFLKSTKTQEPIRVCHVGQSNSGKTTFFAHLMGAMVQRDDEMLYDRVMVISNTATRQALLRTIAGNREIYLSTVLPRFELFSEFHKDLELQLQRQKHNNSFRTLIIFDDADVSIFRSDNFEQYVRQGRHFGIDIAVIFHNMIYIQKKQTRSEFDVFYHFQSQIDPEIYSNLPQTPSTDKQVYSRIKSSLRFETGKRYCIHVPRSSRFSSAFAFRCELRCNPESLLRRNTLLFDAGAQSTPVIDVDSQTAVEESDDVSSLLESACNNDSNNWTTSRSRIKKIAKRSKKSNEARMNKRMKV